MKNFLSKVPKATYILIILAAFLITFGATYSSTIIKYKATPIIDVKNGAVLSENEGKNICTSGKLTVLQAPYDKDLGIKVDGIAIIETVEMYQYYISNDTVLQGFRSDQKDNIKGRGGEDYKNPEFPKDMKNKLFVAKVAIGNGDMEIDESYIDAIVNNDSKYKKEVNRILIDNVTIEGFKPCGDGYLTNGNPDAYKIGDIRVKYEYIKSEDVGEVTICGYQGGNKLFVGTYELGGLSAIYDSVITSEEILKENVKEYKLTEIGIYIFAVIIIGIGIIVFIINKNKNTKTNKKRGVKS